MTRASLLARLATPHGSTRPSQLTHRKVTLEPLEDRKMLATVYFNDNWVNLTNPGQAPVFFDQVDNSNDPVNPGTISGFYGIDAFGTATNGGETGSTKIHDAITASQSGDTLLILPGTYKESDIVITHPLTVQGSGQTGTGRTIIVPEVASSKVNQSDFSADTHSGFIINSGQVTIQNLTIDGSGPTAAPGGFNFHHGITTPYMPVTTIRDGVLPANNFGSAHLDTNIMIQNVTVTNVAWHGITLSGASEKTIGENTVYLTTVSNVGEPGSQDLNRVGILLQNNKDAQIVASTVTNAGVGMASGILGQGTYNGGSPELARNITGMRDNTVTDAVARAYSVSFQEGLIDLNFLLLGVAAQFEGFDNNKAVFNNVANNATGLYLNHSQPVVAGFVSTNAKIGVHVQNTTFDPASGELIAPVISGTTLTGPGIAVAGSYGILAENNDGSSNNSVAVGAAGVTTISNYQTGIRIHQSKAPGDAKLNTAYIERIRVTGNGTGVSVGDGSIVQGYFENVDSLVTTGNGVVYPGVPDSFFLVSEQPFPVPDPAPAPVYASAAPDIIETGNTTFGSSGTFSALLTGNSGTTPIFTFDNAATYADAFLPPNPSGGTTTVPYGSSFGMNVVQQNGTTDSLVLGSDSVNSPLKLLFGTNNHPDPNNSGVYILDPTDISDRTTIELKLKVAPENQAAGFLFGLSDINGNLAIWTISLLDVGTDWTTVSLNISGLAIPLELNGDAPGNFDLSRIVGYAVLGDQGLFNGAQSVPFRMEIDDVSAGTIRNSVLKVTGTVDLGGANLAGSLADGFVPTNAESFMIIDNDGVDPVVGTFNGIPQGGSVSIGGQSFTVSYTGGDGNDVVLTKSNAPNPPSVVGRRIFYNGSKYDSFDQAINANDDGAIATDKTPYFAGGGVATSASATNYTNGINGLMVDIANPSTPLNASDFTFKVNNGASNNDPSTWTLVAATPTVSVRPGAGQGGSDRVEIIFPNGAIKQTWLQVTVKGNDAAGGFNTHSGLTTSDTFYFGNHIGDTFENPGPVTFVTNGADEIAARNNPGALQPVTSLYDFDKNSLVNAADQIAARNNGGIIFRINIPAPGPLPSAAPATEEDGSGSAVASALAAKSLPGGGAGGWVASRLAKVDLNSGPVAALFTRLAEADTARSHSILLGANRITDALGLDDSLLESLIDDLGIG